jgi:hypothetical protein
MSIFYLDYLNGNDSTTNTPLGWWSIDFTNGDSSATGDSEPIANELATGLTSGSTAKVTVVVTTGGTWIGGNASGTIYWYGKSNAFQSETLSFAGGATCSIGGDFTYCAWKTITSGATSARIAPGDTIRIAKSPDPVSLGVTGSWTKCPEILPTSKNIESSTNASPINIKITGHGYSTGDIICLLDHTTNLTANGTWIITKVDDDNFTLDGSSGIGVGGATGNCTKINWMAVKLSSAVTKTITRCEQLWTVVNSSTISLKTANPDYKEGDASISIAKTSPVNNTLYAYFTIGGGAGVNFSSYQRISFWIKNGTAITANQWKICLCSDTVGTTIVDTVNIPAIVSTGRWICLTLTGDNSNLGNSIQSVALYSGSSAGSNSGIILDNIIACSTNGLSLESLISKDSLAYNGTDPCFTIQSVSEDGKVIRLDNGYYFPNTKITARGGGYSGTTEIVTTYIRETIKTILASASGSYVQEIQESGTESNNIEFQGGYDPTTNSQNGETYFDGINVYGYGITGNAKSYITLNRISIVRYYFGYDFLGACSNIFISCTNAIANAQSNIRIEMATPNSYNFNINVNNLSSSGAGYSIDLNWVINLTINCINMSNSNNIGLQMNRCYQSTFNVTNILNNGAHGIQTSECNYVTVITTHSSYNGSSTQNGLNIVYTCNSIFDVTNIKYNNYYGVGIANSSFNKIRNTTFSDNVIATIGVGVGVQNGLYNCNFPMTGTDVLWLVSSLTNLTLYSQNHNNSGLTRIYITGGQIDTDDTIVHTPGIAWKISPSLTERTINYPIKLTVATVAVVENKLVTVKAYLKKTSLGDIGAKLVCPGGQIAGVPSDVTVIIPSSDTNWHENQITFTPTETGIIQIEIWAYWVTGVADESIYVDDMSISQA